MQSLPVHLNYYTIFFLIPYKERQMSSLSTKERRAQFNSDDLIFRKESKFTFWNTTIFIKLC